jgi:hypothetical protein
MQITGEEGSALGQAGGLRRRIAELQCEHRELDEAIIELVESGLHDELQLQRMKKRKLLLKDTIARLEMGLVPDIPA